MRHLPQMLAQHGRESTIWIARRKVFRGQIPDPFGAVGQDDFLFRTAPTTLPSFSIDALAKLYRAVSMAPV